MRESRRRASAFLVARPTRAVEVQHDPLRGQRGAGLVLELSRAPLLDRAEVAVHEALVVEGLHPVPPPVACSLYARTGPEVSPRSKATEGYRTTRHQTLDTLGSRSWARTMSSWLLSGGRGASPRRVRTHRGHTPDPLLLKTGVKIWRQRPDAKQPSRNISSADVFSDRNETALVVCPENATVTLMPEESPFVIAGKAADLEPPPAGFMWKGFQTQSLCDSEEGGEIIPTNYFLRYSFSSYPTQA